MSKLPIILGVNIINANNVGNTLVQQYDISWSNLGNPYALAQCAICFHQHI